MASWTTQPAPGPEGHRPAARLTLPTGVVDVWRARVDRPAGAFGGWLSTEERERASRFRFDDDRSRWVAAHAVLRGVLARYLAASPQSLVFTVGEHDKPALAVGHDAEWLRFNLAHSRDLALVGVARGRAVGIDVEAVEDRGDLLGIARRVLDRDVVSTLERMAPGSRPTSFFPAWVRHEAQTKCGGTGLTDDDDAADRDDHERVVVVDLDVGPGYCAALAAATRPEQVRYWDWTA